MGYGRPDGASQSSARRAWILGMSAPWMPTLYCFAPLLGGTFRFGRPRVGRRAMGKSSTDGYWASDWA